MARELTGLQRVLDVPSLAAVAYGEIASSLYFALGIIALYALGFTPWVLLAVGLLFLLVALSYAEGTAAIPEIGGAATLVRRAFNDQAGFLTGWALFLDYLIVIALAGLFVPHYLGDALGAEGLTGDPWDTVVGVGVILTVAAVRLVRRPSLYGIAIGIAAIAVVTHLLLIFLGFAFLFSWDNLGKGVDLGAGPTWDSIAFALPLAMLAYTGLETVANLASETREPGRTLPRSLFAGIGAAVAVSYLVAVVGISAFPASADPAGSGDSVSELGNEWRTAPLYGIATAFEGELPSTIVDILGVFVGLSGAVVLVAAVTTSISGAARLAYSLGRYEMLPRAFARLSPRSLIPAAGLIAIAGVACVILVVAVAIGSEVRSLASLYSFGVLLAFAAAQVAVIRLRMTEPDLPRPFRVPGNIRWRGRELPIAALLGIPLCLAIWIIAIGTHEAPRIVGPLWLLAGAGVFIATRRTLQTPLRARVTPAEGDLDPFEEGAYQRLLVPLKLGPIGDEVLATAIKLAEERGSSISVLHVVRVPPDLALDAELPEAEERGWTAIAEAKLLASEHNVDVEGEVVRARALGEAIVERARADEVDLVMLGSAARWRRQSRFFSPTVEHVLRKADCEVMVIAYPQGVLEEEEESANA